MKQKPSLFSLLIKAFLPVVVLPLLIVGLVAGLHYQHDRRSVENQIEADLIRTSFLRKKFIETAITNAVDSLQLAATAWPRFQDDPDPNQALRDFSYRLSGVTEVSVAASDGLIHYSSQSSSVGVSLAQKPYWKGFQAKRGLTFSDLILRDGTRRVILILLPLANGEALIGAYDTAQLQAVFREARTPWRENFTFLVDNKGQLITHSNEFYLVKGVNYRRLPPVSRALRGYQGAMTFQDPESGVELSAAYIPLPLAGWALVLAQPSARTLLLPALSAQRDNLLILLAGVALASIATTFLSHHLARPVEKVSLQVEQLSREQILPERAETLKPEEMGVIELERAVESAMVLYKALAHTIVQLEAKTNELSLANHEMEATVENLKRLDKLKADFLNALSHDLRIPITAIVGYSELLQDLPTLSVDAQGYVERILEACRGMQSMVEELLDYARLEVGRVSIRLETVDIRAALLEAEAFFKPLAQQKNLVLSLVAVQDLPLVQTDPDRLRQILNNLISNAIKYTPEGGQVTICAARLNGSVYIEVRDTGIGLSHEDERHLFEKFYRSLRPEVQREKGSGLGLSLVKGALDALGGSLEVESLQGKGSSFGFSLPAMVEAHPPRLPQAKDGSP